MTPDHDTVERDFRLPVVVLALLSVTAGFADGYSLSRFDVFVANQTGNVVHVGMGVVGAYDAWDLALLSIVGFGVGGMVSWLLARSVARRDRLARSRLAAVVVLVVAWWAAVTGLAALGSGIQPQAGRVSAFVGAAAMGVMASVLTHVAGVRAQPTYQSTTVLNSFQGLLDWLVGSEDDHRSGRALALVGGLTIGCYAAGGGAGALMAQHATSALLLVVLPLAACLVLTRREGALRASAEDQ